MPLVFSYILTVRSTTVFPEYNRSVRPLPVQITGNPLYDGKHLPAIALFSGFQNCSNQSKFRITDLSPIFSAYG
ncbi:hypothetical protein DRQ26_01955 [bacterium]|nr:MAG: hypothetical protein DRQ26_01955 [bacterium]